ncbi:hypothetical protein GGI02_003629 [Coemansia sp. RSA 2322]|nr:hypothetical protein GGI02_003629 [Coemansia sp. RSA 2322]
MFAKYGFEIVLRREEFPHPALVEVAAYYSDSPGSPELVGLCPQDLLDDSSYLAYSASLECLQDKAITHCVYLVDGVAIRSVDLGSDSGTDSCSEHLLGVVMFTTTTTKQLNSGPGDVADASDDADPDQVTADQPAVAVDDAYLEGNTGTGKQSGDMHTKRK